jgi:TfoX/Sxy family transcriptional regulator of competence genes
VAYDEDLAARVRALLGDRIDVEEKAMFSGLSFLLNGNIAVGVTGDDLLVRVGKEDAESLEAERGARRFDGTGRPMRGWVLVAPSATSEDADLERWVRRGEEFAASLPPK